ncbi:dihydroneopterin aldolase [Entomobacter blattae]|uniref:7,8-dihydroneopterin aldolase n=1 Tax=Entomobacter blattae TaxID=2762277 RepID=A0A7H1NTI7_9PROT|nr:dihydroneopterin aldolase [Entomobacter blattae]QNT79097.1 Dihydroneopterin aldolase [Entomobacter blattae]
MAPFSPKEGWTSLRHIFVSNMLVQAEIGIYEHEKGITQPVRINVSVGIKDVSEGFIEEDNLEKTVSYADLVVIIRDIVREGHINLVETLAEKISKAILQDKRIVVTRVKVEKLNIMPDVEAVGTEIERYQPVEESS